MNRRHFTRDIDPQAAPKFDRGKFLGRRLVQQVQPVQSGPPVRQARLVRPVLPVRLERPVQQERLVLPGL